MKKRYKKGILFSAFLTVFFLIGTPQANAVPTLQLYIDGSEYIGATEISGVPVDESWFTTSKPLSLQVIGATSPDSVDYIRDVTLWIAIQQEDYENNPDGSISVKDSDGDNVLAFSDPPAFGTPPDLSPHGIYPAYYYQYNLPNLEVTKIPPDPIWDYNEDYDPLDPGPPADTGDIQEYKIFYEEFFWLHMDLTGVAVATDGSEEKTWTRFAPYSHDADAPAIPEPASMLLLGTGLIGLAGFRRKFRKR